MSARGVRYLIAGGGMTADAAVAGIREHDRDGSIAVIGAESDPPYKRPLLTKGLWSGDDESKVWLRTGEVAGVELITGRSVVSIDPSEHAAVDDAGETYRYEQLLLATGATPREIPNTKSIVYFRTLADYRFVRERAVPGERVVVIGGGFIGSEIAAALVGAGCEVTMVFPEPAIGWRLFPAELAQFVSRYYEERGVDVRHDETVSAADEFSVTLGSGTTLDANVVIAGVGVEPTTALGAEAGLAVDNGFVVDEYGHVEGQTDIFAAGDVANFPVSALGKRLRIEHEDHARSHGRAVGANMAGANVPYDHLPFFYSDLFDLGYEAVGEVDSRQPRVEHWVEPNRKGVVASVDENGRPRGFLLWNTWDSVEVARGLIRDGKPIESGTLASVFS
ncbi:MAG TPA: FAD-dependent oxidoreductase [Gaiellaceae bacterium]|nr:FAD-dependent oxidoreductase [Gaiellaceae bacterium]